MRALLQRVTSGQVSINGKVVGRTSKGLVIFLGVRHTDTIDDARYLVDKCANLRIFEDNAGKMNLSLIDTQGSTLIISQFTLYADSKTGRRPSFFDAARPEIAIPLYETFIEEFRKLGIPTETGQFGADMQVEIHNDGPVTLMVESK